MIIYNEQTCKWDITRHPVEDLASDIMRRVYEFKANYDVEPNTLRLTAPYNLFRLTSFLGLTVKPMEKFGDANFRVCLELKDEE